MFFGCVATSDLYLFQEIVLLNSCFLFSKNLILSFIDKLTTGTYSSVLFIWNVATLNCVDGKRSVGGLAVELAGASGVLDISEMTQSSVHDKSSSISHFSYSNVNQKISKNYLNILMEQQVLCLMYCYRLVFFLFFYLTLKRFTYCSLVVIYSVITSFVIFICIINRFISWTLYSCWRNIDRLINYLLQSVFLTKTLMQLNRLII